MRSFAILDSALMRAVPMHDYTCTDCLVKEIVQMGIRVINPPSEETLSVSHGSTRAGALGQPEKRADRRIVDLRSVMRE